MFRIVIAAIALCSAPAWGQTGNRVAYVGYGFQGPAPVAPGQVIALFVRGLNVPNSVADRVPLPTTLSGLTVTVANPPTPEYPTRLPILSVRSSPDSCAGGVFAFCDTTAVTVQFPFEPICIPTGGIPNECTIGLPPPVKIVVEADGVDGEEFWFGVVSLFPHVLNTCNAIFGIGGICSPLITHADGSLVSASAPAQTGEVVTLWAVGLGPTQGGAKTGEASASADPIVTDFYLTWAFRVETPPGSPAPPPKYVQSGEWIKAEFAGLAEGFVGLYQINIRLPGDLPDGAHQCQIGADTNLRLLVGPGSAAADYTEFVDLCVRK